MKTILATMLTMLISISLMAQVRVKGYYRKDGTYVQPHTRSSPDSNPYNNYSYPGNVNPYTGKTATGESSTYLERNYSKWSNSIYSPRYIESSSYPKRKRMYFNDDDGIKVRYIIPYQKDSAAIRYVIFSMNDEYEGYASLYHDGSYLLFDQKGEMIDSGVLEK